MTRFIETTRIVQQVTQDDVDVARLTGNDITPTKLTGRYKVDLEAVVDFSEDLTTGESVTCICLSNGRTRVIEMSYDQFNEAHQAHFNKGYTYKLNIAK